MRLLLDTHAFLWWLADDKSLSKEVRKLIGNSSSVFVSAASAWEIATKVRIGKLPEGSDLAADFQGFLFRNRFESLPINSEHAIRAGLLPGPHRDPFDRMLIAQAQSENLVLVSNEVVFDQYGVRRFW